MFPLGFRCSDEERPKDLASGVNTVQTESPERPPGSEEIFGRDSQILVRESLEDGGFRSGANGQSSEVSPAASAFFCLRYSLKKLRAKIPTMRAKVSHRAYLSMTLRMSTAASPS